LTNSTALKLVSDICRDNRCDLRKCWQNRQSKENPILYNNKENKTKTSGSETKSIVTKMFQVLQFQPNMLMTSQWYMLDVLTHAKYKDCTIIQNWKKIQQGSCISVKQNPPSQFNTLIVKEYGYLAKEEKALKLLTHFQ
jgi:hypothetical protein